MNSERELTSAFSYYLRKQKPLPKFLTKSYAIEFKFLKGKTLNFNSDIRPQQIPSLLQVKHSCLYNKISDQSMGMKPFDSFNICKSDAWLAICWNKDIYFLDIDFIEAYMKENKSIDRATIVIKSSYNITI